MSSIAPPAGAAFQSNPMAMAISPDGRRIVFAAHGADGSGLWVRSLDGAKAQLLAGTEGAECPFWSPDGRSIGFNADGKLEKEGSLHAQRFDPGRPELSGEAIALIDGVQYMGVYQSHLFSLPDDGKLVFIAGEGTLTRRFTRIDRRGVVLETIGKPGNRFPPRFSHDGRRIAFDQSEALTDSGDIWVLDRERGVVTRLTFDPRNESAPVWSPDDRRILFFGNFPNRTDLLAVPSAGTGKPETILSDGTDNLPTDWPRDGKFILSQRSHGSGMSNTDLWIYALEERQAEAWLDSPYSEGEARFSPDGRWIPCRSNESARMEVYVRGFRPPGGKWRVSIDGGSSPVWRADGNELFYLPPDSTLVSVAVRPGATFDATRRLSSGSRGRSSIWGSSRSTTSPPTARASS